MRIIVSLISTLLLMLVAASSLASRVVVPTDVATIQAAVDGTADTIAVLDDLVPERLTIGRSVVIEPVVGALPFLRNWASLPLVRSLEIVRSVYGTPQVSMRGVRFLGNVAAPDLYSDGDITFEACRFDSGFAGPGGGVFTTFVHFRVEGCLFLADAKLSGYVQFMGNTVLGGALRVRADGLHDIHDNFIEGPAEAGMVLNLSESAGEVYRNAIRGTGDGIRFEHGDGLTVVTGNEISDCSGDGIHYAFGDVGTANCSGNRIERVQGHGIRLEYSDVFFGGVGVFDDNSIHSAGLDGISLPGCIIPHAKRNEILDAKGVGFRAALVDSFVGNVIGRCGGAGLEVTRESHLVSQNTIFSNAGAGILLSAVPFKPLKNNVVAFNGGPGLGFTCTASHGGTCAPVLDCNDWFGNSGGATVGVAPGATDLAVNPFFCDLPNGDVHLSADSPLLDAPGCGRIGALDEGCTSAAEEPIHLGEPGGGTPFRTWPVPAAGPVHFALPDSRTPTSIEVFDVTGARRWSTTLPAGLTRFDWDGRDGSGRAMSPGIYFARIRQEGTASERVRLVLQ